MARTISATALAVIAAGGTYDTTLTVTLPGESPVTVETDRGKGWSVSDNLVVAGPRLGIGSITILPHEDVDDLFAFVGYPGATFDASIGVKTSGSGFEWIDVFHGYAAEGSAVRNSLGVGVSLHDPWNWCNEVPFTEPLATTVADRDDLIAALFTPVPLPSLTVVSTATGGAVSQAGVYTGKRGEAAAQLAADGLLRVSFNESGALAIKAQEAIIDITATDWTFAGGVGGNIIRGTLERTRAFSDGLCNAIAVVPAAPWQTWSAQVVELTATGDPRHKSKIGLRGIQIASATCSTAAEAKALAQRELTRRLRGSDERVKFQVLLNPAIESGDRCSVTASAVEDDAGWSANYIITSATHTPSGDKPVTSVEAVSAGGYNITS